MDNKKSEDILKELSEFRENNLKILRQWYDLIKLAQEQIFKKI